MVIETTGIITAVVESLRRGATVSRVAAAFHTTLADIIVQTCCQIRRDTGLQQVALSGGVFQNVRLLTESVNRLAAEGFTVYTHHQVPPNDGGLALGQIVVANALLAQGH
jgi:hydrogenase maturation protein HypF